MLSVADPEESALQMVPMPESVTAALEPIKASPLVRRIVLFGSRAIGDAGPMSDVDLAISAPEMDAAAWARLRDAVAQARTLYQISLIKIEDMPPALRSAVNAHGWTIYERP